MSYDKRTYKSWEAMKQRCTNPLNDAYINYGGRGITYDPKWEKFAGFFEDMGIRPEGRTLDRIDNDGNYCKENCRWATKEEQAKNRQIRTKPAPTSTTGIHGVYFVRARGYYKARVNHKGKLIHLYYGPSIEKAIAARNNWTPPKEEE